MNTTIFHIDVNSAFLSWEAAYRIHILGESVDLRKIPSVVGGDKEKRHGIVLAKSIPTKKYKISTGEPIVSAIKKCPNLVVVPPNFSLYLAASREFINYLKKYAVEIWQYSIDEAFCDFSGTEGIYGQPLTFAHQLQQQIYEDLGFTVNIGVSSNKLLAKMASEMKKPNQVISLYPEEIPSKMWPLPVAELFYVGKKTQDTLKKLGIKTIGELAHTDLSILKSHFKSHGETIYNYANGKDLEFDLKQEVSNKGYGNSTTLAKDVTTWEESKLILLSLCESVSARVRADQAFIQVISISIVYSDFTHHRKQMTLASPLNTTMEIHKHACHLFDLLWNHSPIRQLGVGTSHATKTKIHQYNFLEGNRFEQLEKADAAIDKIRKIYGKDSVMRASFLNQSKQHIIGGFSTFGSKEKKNPNEDTHLNK